GAAIASVESASPGDAVGAASAASAARGGWRATAPHMRAELLAAIASHLVRREDELASTIVAQNGKTYEEARGEIGFARSFFETYAVHCRRLEQRSIGKRRA